MRAAITITVGCKDCGHAYKGARKEPPWPDEPHFADEAYLVLQAALRGLENICTCRKSQGK
jgi:hypothetical protein